MFDSEQIVVGKSSNVTMRGSGWCGIQVNMHLLILMSRQISVAALGLALADSDGSV